ncbi:MAG TPA: DNA repair protein [Spirochaeta sp.]|nr:DNA repair protein [Spirochaeta sp.]
MVVNETLVLDAKRVRGLYRILSKHYGPQGWWPLRSRRITSGAHIQHTIGFNSGGYHPGTGYDPGPAERFEIAVGAVLTQNTNWHNAAAALDALIKENLLSAEKILALPLEKLAGIIRPCGYYNQKAIKLKAVAEVMTNNDSIPGREELLSIWGIGPETADAILLYAFGRPAFVIDAYTRRIFSRFTGLETVELISYNQLQSAVQNVFCQDLESCREYHALLILHAKRYCTKNPRCAGCPAAGACKKRKCLQNE